MNHINYWEEVKLKMLMVKESLSLWRHDWRSYAGGAVRFEWVWSDLRRAADAAAEEQSEVVKELERVYEKRKKKRKKGKRKPWVWANVSPLRRSEKLALCWQCWHQAQPV